MVIYCENNLHNLQVYKMLCHISNTCKKKKNPSLVLSGDRKMPTKGSTNQVGNEAFPSFPLELLIRELGFSVSTEHQWSILFSLIYNFNIVGKVLWFFWQCTVLYVTPKVTSEKTTKMKLRFFYNLKGSPAIKFRLSSYPLGINSYPFNSIGG